MKLGVSLPTSGAWATPENQVLMACEAEALGYDSLWTFQRLLLPLAPRNDYPPMPGQPWPDFMRSVMDPIVPLAFVAARTSRIRLGVSVVVMPYYAPVVLAKQLATLDILSGGRLEVGLGLGWSRDEYDAAGVPFEARGRRGDEFIRCLRAIWSEPVVEFAGEFYLVPRSLVEPKPLQKPHPPVMVGGYGPAAVRRAVTLADGFMGGNVALDRVTPLIRDLREAAAMAGRDPGMLRIICRGTYRVFDAPQGPDRRPLFGSLDEIRRDVDRYAEAGLTELFLDANIEPMSARLDRALEVMQALAPAR
jgi:probable F420-dependent oxidoreductase